MTENPYQSPGGEPAIERRFRIRFIPAAIFFIFGLILLIGNGSLLALTPVLIKSTSTMELAGYAVFIFAGASWMVAGRYWNKGAWTLASVWSIVGYFAGVAAAILQGSVR